FFASRSGYALVSPDWSSDVCSSDLAPRKASTRGGVPGGRARHRACSRCAAPAPRPRLDAGPTAGRQHPSEGPAMGDYVQLPNVPVWYETEDDTGKPVVLLHGGLCTNETWGAQRTDLAAVHRVFLPERRGHGHTPDVPGPMSYRDMADDTAAFIDTVVDGPAHLVGWSDGGIVALLVALARPDLVRTLVVIGANFRPGAECWADPAMLDRMRPESPDMAFFREL